MIRVKLTLVVSLFCCFSAAVRYAYAWVPYRMGVAEITMPGAGDLGQPLTSYYTEIFVGSPSKNIKFLIDINAREVWMAVYSNETKDNPELNFKNGYDRKFSMSTQQNTFDEFKIVYDGCQLTGQKFKETYQFRAVRDYLRALALFQLEFLAISSASNHRFARRGELDGVLALNSWPVSETGSDLMSSELARVGVMNDLRYGIVFDNEKWRDDEKGFTGEINVGALNQDRFIGEPKYHKIVAQYAWELKLQGVMLGSASVTNYEPEGSTSAKLSTVHNDIHGPSEDVQRILTLLGFESDINANGFIADKLYDIDCSKTSTAPNITFNVEGSLYEITAKSYIKQRSQDKAECYVAILSNWETPGAQWILGTYFMQNFYTVLDIDGRQVALLTPT